jgi:hypothetical protein
MATTPGLSVAVPGRQTISCPGAAFAVGETSVDVEDPGVPEPEVEDVV